MAERADVTVPSLSTHGERTPCLMRRKRLARSSGVLGLVAVAVFAGMAPASAGQPSWSMTVENTPSVVAAGSEAGFEVTISNAGPSNISKLSLATDTTVAPDFVTTTQGTCTAPGRVLSCNLGTLRTGASVTVAVAFPTSADASSFTAGFFATTCGASSSDKGHSSHGDTLRDPNEAATQLTNSPDFAGGFSLDGAPVSTDPYLSTANVQSTTVVPPKGDVVATAQDGLGSDAFSCTGCTGTLFGEWSSVNVDNGAVQSGLIKVTLTVRKDQIPYGTKLRDIVLVHVLDNGTTEILSQRCCRTPTAGCISVTQLRNGDVQITGYVTENGGFKGMG
jgi:Domain of unknown function DUF11